MRDSNRINSFCQDFALYWKEYYPDLRFGQICDNFFSWIKNTKGKDPWYIEENNMLMLLTEYCDTKGGSWDANCD